MSFPVTEAFRGSAGNLASANWTQLLEPAGAATLQQDGSNHGKASAVAGNDVVAGWVPDAPSANHWGAVAIGAVVAGDSYNQVVLRGANDGGTGNWTGYMVFSDGTVAQTGVSRFVDGAETSLTAFSPAPPTFAAGDEMGASVTTDASGNVVISLYKNRVLVSTTTDSSASKVTRAGSFGCGVFNNTLNGALINGFRGGDGAFPAQMPARRRISIPGRHPSNARRRVRSALAYAQVSTGLNNYTLTCDVGAFSETGQAATLREDRRLSQAPATFALSGQAAAPVRSYTLALATGTFTEAGQADSLVEAHRLQASVGTYVVNGQAATLVKGRSLDASGAATFVLSGQPATLREDHKLGQAVGAYALNGKAAALVRSYTLAAAPGSFAFTGKAANLLEAHALSQAKGTFALGGQAAALLEAHVLSQAKGAFTLSGQAAALSKSSGSFSLSAGPGAFSLGGAPAGPLLLEDLVVDGSGNTISGATVDLFRSDTDAFVATTVSSALGKFRFFVPLSLAGINLFLRGHLPGPTELVGTSASDVRAA